MVIPDLKACPEKSFPIKKGWPSAGQPFGLRKARITGGQTRF
jgi:hypothetical protein